MRMERRERRTQRAALNLMKKLGSMRKAFFCASLMALRNRPLQIIMQQRQGRRIVVMARMSLCMPSDRMVSISSSALSRLRRWRLLDWQRLLCAFDKRFLIWAISIEDVYSARKSDATCELQPQLSPDPQSPRCRMMAHER